MRFETARLLLDFNELIDRRRWIAIGDIK